MQPNIEVRDLRKRYGRTPAVDGLSFTVRPGQVTGFVGPNGAGKSTTMRVILGLDRPDAGSATVGGRPYRSLRAPLREVGALLDAAAVHPGRRARDHLMWMVHSNGLPKSRVDIVLEMVGLAEAARCRAGGFSLGMRQRLGIAAALLGDPPVLMLDEPGWPPPPPRSALHRLTPVAGLAIIQTTQRFDTAISLWGGVGVLAGYLAVAMLTAILVLRRRDA